MKITREEQLKRAIDNIRPVICRTVEDQCTLAEAGWYSDKIKQNLDEVQHHDMAEHCKNYKAIEIPKMKYDLMAINRISGHTFFDKLINEVERCIV